MFLTQEEKEIELQRNKRRIVANCKYCHGTGFVQKTDADGYDKSFICSCSSIVQRNIRLVDWGFPKKFLDDERWNLKLLQGRPYYESVKLIIFNLIMMKEKDCSFMERKVEGKQQLNVLLQSILH